MAMAVSVFLFVVLVVVVESRHGRLRIVAFHSPEDGLYRDIAFKYAVQHMNNDIRHTDILDEEIKAVKPFDSFNTGMITCDLAAKGIGGVFGPQSTTSTGVVRSICESLEIPHVVTTWEPNGVISQYTNNLYPDPEVLSLGLADVLRHMKWRSYTVLYQDESALIRLQGILQGRSKGDVPIVVRQLDPFRDYRPMLKEIKMSTETKIVLDCAVEDILEILRAAATVDLMDVYCSYLITSLDAHTVDYSEFRDPGPNITVLRIVDPSSPIVENTVRDWIDGEKRKGKDLSLTPETVLTETALMYDAVLLYTEAVVLLNTSEYIMQEPLECRETGKWRRGLEISNFMRLRQIQGMTGLIELDVNGRRTSFNIDIIEYTRVGFRKTGEWNPTTGYTNTRSFAELDTQITSTLGRKLMIVTSKLGPPYLMERNQTDPPTLFGNDRYEGFSMDLIDEIARELKFKYEFRLVPDGKQGNQDPKTGEWNGLLGELLNRRADFAICDLTITYEREKAVDFTMPFMNLGITILYKKTVKTETNLFSFLKPFSFDVWIYMATAYLGVSVVLFLLSRISPYEWISKHPCQAEPTELENTLSMNNSIWHNCGSLMQQGSDIAPQAVSTRMVAGMWWFFTLIMISSYTANLAAFLTVAKMEEDIKGVEDLATQTKIKYGVYKFGSTARFFETSNVSVYQRIWSTMQQARPEVFTKDNTEGLERVQKGKGHYAFFAESTTIDYQMERNCDLVKIGRELDSKGYGIAMPPDSPYRVKMNEVILKLQEGGKLKLLKNRWWKEKGGGMCNRNQGEDDTDSNKLGLPNVGGVFLVLFFGCSSAFVVSILEFLWNCRKIAVEEKITPCEAIASELKFAMHCSADSKPVSRRAPEPEAEMLEEGSFLQMNYEKYGIEHK